MTLVFLLKLTLCWGFFALLYALLLRGETFFRTNRAYLLGTVVLGILLSLDRQWLPDLPVKGSPLLVLPTFTVGLQQAEAVVHQWAMGDYVWLIYLLGVGFLLLRLGWALIRLVLMAVRGGAEVLPDGCLLLRSNATAVPFSFFKWIFVPLDFQADSEDRASALDAMLIHERAHAQGWHSADVLAMELLCVVFWFHPLVHWYRRALRSVHEYLADAEASRDIDLKQYGLLLIRQSQPGMPVALVHHFFQSPLKQRLIMLTKKASAPANTLKYGLLLPITLLFVLLFRQAPVVAQSLPQEPNTAQQVEKMPTYPGGQDALLQFLATNIIYPAAARTDKAEGMVVMRFIVGADGTLRDIGEKPGASRLREEFSAEAKRVIELMPKWIPGEKNGQKVACEMVLPIRFKLD